MWADSSLKNELVSICSSFSHRPAYICTVISLVSSYVRFRF